MIYPAGEGVSQWLKELEEEANDSTPETGHGGTIERLKTWMHHSGSTLGALSGHPWPCDSHLITTHTSTQNNVAGGSILWRIKIDGVLWRGVHIYSSWIYAIHGWICVCLSPSNTQVPHLLWRHGVNCCFSLQKPGCWILSLWLSKVNISLGKFG